MAQVISNIVKPNNLATTPINASGGSSPASLALNNKTNTSTIPYKGNSDILSVANALKGAGYNPSQTPTMNTPQTSGQSTLAPLTHAPVDSSTHTDTLGNTAKYTYNTDGLVSQTPQTPQTQPTTPTPTFPGLISGISNTAQGNIPIGQNAQQIASQYGQEISDIGQRGAAARGGYLTTGTTPVAEGNAAVIAQTTAAQQQAAAQGEQAALQGTGQQLTAQQQAQQGLLGAAGLEQPQLGAFGQGYYNPVTGQVIGGAGPGGQVIQPGNPLYNSLQTYAQGLANNTIPFNQIPGSITGNPVLLSQLLNMAGQGGQGGTGFNLTQNLATTAGQQNALTNLPTWNAANTAAKGIQNTIATYLQSNPTLNSNPLAAANAVTQWLQGKQLSDPKYQTLIDYLTEYTNTLAPVLGVGGDTTNLKTELAQSLVNAQASGQSINEVLNNIGALADTKIFNYQSGALGGAGTTGTSGGGLYDF